MNNAKKCRVIMLPTENGNRLLYLSTDVTPNLLSNWRGKAQELYVISDDEIKDGDKVVNLYDNSLREVSSFHNDISIFTANNSDYIKKIIATTDTTLKEYQQAESHGETIEIENTLPQLSQEFVENYIESYNKGEIITNVLVEMNEKCCKCDTYEQESKCCYSVGDIDGTCTAPNPNNDFYGLRIKVNPDNTINIKKLKDSWDRKEVLKIIDYCWGYKNESIQTKQEWVEKNL